MATPLMIAHAHRVRDLNDAFRRSYSGGRVVLAAGIATLTEATRTALLTEVQGFDAVEASDANNDPYGEHDFGEGASGEVRALWKIDAYDRALTFASPDPTDLAVTVRLLTVMLAEEYSGWAGAS